jgi:hypothetical protein
MATRVDLSSTLLQAAAYQPEDELLEVEFRTGAVYRYCDVPVSIYEELLQADSKGRYFNQHIRNRFPTKKIDSGNSNAALHQGTS